MRITVQAHHPHHGQLARAGRFWSTKEETAVEVLDQDDDPPPIKVKTRNSTTGAEQETNRPDPTRIGRTTYKILLADTRLSVKQGDSVNERAADAAIAAAHTQVAQLSAQVLDLQTKLARTEAERDEAMSLVDEVKKANAEADAEVEEKPSEVEGKGKGKGESKKGSGK